jgi:hypothetical protein
MGFGRISKYPVYPFLVAALPVVHFYEANFKQLEPGDGLRMVGLFWVITGSLLILGRWLWGDVNRAAMVVAPLAVVLFLGNRVGGLIALGFLLLTVGVGVFLLRRPCDVGRGSVPLNVAMLVLVGLPCVQTFVSIRSQNSPVPTAVFTAPLEIERSSDGLPPPDIYFLLLDALGQPEFLERKFQVPPELLSGVLESRGFQVLRSANANYQQTALSLAATLNLNYLHELLDIPDPDNADRRVLARLVAQNRAVQALKGVGYDLVTYPSGYPLTRLEEPVRRHRPLVNPSFLEYYVLEDGILPLVQPLLGLGPADFSFGLRRNRLEYVFDHLTEARTGIPEDKPVFVFAHIMAPHPPFVFSSTGEALRSRETFAFADGNHWYDIHGRDGIPYSSMYSEQLVYVMKRLGEAIDGILAASPRPPVIIVQGDHGPGSELHLERVMYSDHQERFGIFNAWYTPPGVELELEEGATALNTFPTLFNALFDAGLPLREDRFFYARMSMPYAHLELSPTED